MGIVARGSLVDRSAPRLVAALAARAFTGELIIEGGPRPFRLAWAQGAIIGAQSPHPADSAAKVALTLGVLSSTQAGEVARVIASNRGVDELEVVAQAARLSSELVGRLARRLAGARAARALAVETGTFIVDDIQPFWGNVAPVDARWVLYSGVRQHFTVERVERELGGLAAAVRLRAGADLDGFGFGEAEEPVVGRLRAGTLSIAPFPPGVDRQVAQAVVLALLLVGEAEVAQAPVPSSAAAVASPAAVTQAMPLVRTSDPAAATGPVPVVATPSRVATAPIPTTRASTPAIEIVSRGTPVPGVDAPVASGASVQADKTRALIAERSRVLDGGADHFTLLGVTPETAPEEVRARYFGLARRLHPDRLKAAGIEDDQKVAQRLFARMNEAFTVLTDPDKRHKYVQVLRAGGEVAVKAREAEAEAAVRRALDAEERFRLGEMALRHQQIEVAVREFQKAVELDPKESDYHAMLGWGLYVAATNKAATVPVARGHLQRAIEIRPKNVQAYLALGRMARMEGNDAEAVKHFQHALDLAPSNTEAATELRAIESRGKPGGTEKKGLFSRLKKP